MWRPDFNPKLTLLRSTVLLRIKSWTPYNDDGLKGYPYDQLTISSLRNFSKMNKVFFLFVVGVFFVSSLLTATDAVAQDQPPSEPRPTFDTVTIMAPDKPLDLFSDKELKKPSQAAIFAAALPGMGQAKNGKYWKMPMVYGGFVIFASLVDYNNVRFVLFRDALSLSAQNLSDQISDPRLRRLSDDQLRRGRDTFRRNRDFNIILSIGWYGLTVVDAVIDAHLLEFDVNDNLTAQLKPGMLPNDMGILAGGLRLTIPLK